MLKKKIAASLCALCFLVGVWIKIDPVSASTIIQPAYNLVQNAGSDLLRRTTINFHGAGVTASDAGGVTDVNIPGGTSGYNLVENGGTPLTMRTTLNCTGTGITCSDDSMNMVTLVNVPGAVTPSTPRQATLIVGPADISSTGTKACAVSENSGTITGVHLIADAVPTGANLVVDVTKVAFASYTGFGSGTSITAADTPTITTAAMNPRYSDTALTGWTTSILTGDVICVNVTTAPTGGSTYASLSLDIAMATERQMTLVVATPAITSTGTKACSVSENAGTILDVHLISNAVPTGANLIVDVLKVPFASYTGFGSAMSITASDVPTITTAAMNPRYSDGALTGWTTAISAGDVICVGINSAPTGGATFTALTLDIQNP
jgi:hypothetical protein